MQGDSQRCPKPIGQSRTSRHKIILSATDGTWDDAMEIQLHFPDTDVFVLALRQYPELCANVSFVTGKGRKPRAIKLQPVVWDHGKARTTALPAFHTISGADNTGCFSGHTVPLCWTTFLNVDDDVVGEMAKLGINTIHLLES